MESFLDILRTWNKSASDREKLQHIYVAIIVVVTIASGLVALVNVKLGHRLITISGVGVVALVANSLVWALSRAYLFDRLDRKRTTKK